MKASETCGVPPAAANADSLDTTAADVPESAASPASATLALALIFGHIRSGMTLAKRPR
jgi:hypothetical protein